MLDGCPSSHGGREPRVDSSPPHVHLGRIPTHSAGDVLHDPHHQEPACCLWSLLGSGRGNGVLSSPQGSACVATTPRAHPVSAACQASMATPSQAELMTASPVRALDSQPAPPSQRARRWCVHTAPWAKEVSGSCPGILLLTGLQEWNPGFGVWQIREGLA